jgi:alpha-L-arabinofuranosidase
VCRAHHFNKDEEESGVHGTPYRSGMNTRHSVSVTMTPLLAASLHGVNNSLDEPRRVAPVEARIDTAAKEFPHEFPPRSLTILRIAAQ